MLHLRDLSAWTWSAFLYTAALFVHGWASDVAFVGSFAVHCAATVWVEGAHRAEVLIAAAMWMGLKVMLCMEGASMLKQLYGSDTRPYFQGFDVLRAAPFCSVLAALLIAASGRTRSLRAFLTWLWKAIVLLGEIFHYDYALKVAGLVLCPCVWGAAASLADALSTGSPRDTLALPPLPALAEQAAQHSLYALLSLHCVPHAIAVYTLLNDVAFVARYVSVQRMLRKKPERSCLQRVSAAADSDAAAPDVPTDAGTATATGDTATSPAGSPLQKKSVSFSAGTRIVEMPKRPPKKLRLARMPGGGYYVKATN